MPKLQLSPSEMRYVRRLVADDHLVLTEALRRLKTGERIGVVPPQAERVIAADADLSVELLTKIDLAS